MIKHAQSELWIIINYTPVHAVVSSWNYVSQREEKEDKNVKKGYVSWQHP